MDFHEQHKSNKQLSNLRRHSWVTRWCSSQRWCLLARRLGLGPKWPKKTLATTGLASIVPSIVYFLNYLTLLHTISPQRHQKTRNSQISTGQKSFACYKIEAGVRSSKTGSRQTQTHSLTPKVKGQVLSVKDALKKCHKCPCGLFQRLGCKKKKQAKTTGTFG